MSVSMILLGFNPEKNGKDPICRKILKGEHHDRVVLFTPMILIVL